jgi:hypothetical protein
VQTVAAAKGITAGQVALEAALAPERIAGQRYGEKMMMMMVDR